MRQGTIIDATLISAPSSTKNKAGKRDLEMLKTSKGHQWYYEMTVHIGVEKDSGLIHSFVTTAANVHDLKPAAELLHSAEVMVDGDAGYHHIVKRVEMECTTADVRVAIRLGPRQAFPETADGKLLDWIDAAKAHRRAKVEQSFRVMKQQFGVQKTRFRGKAKNRCMVNIIAALTDLFLVRRQ